MVGVHSRVVVTVAAAGHREARVPISTLYVAEVASVPSHPGNLGVVIDIAR